MFVKNCDCSKDKLDPSDVDVIAFQIQLYELGLDPDWIHRQVQYRGMESRERLRYELDGTERFFFDGVPSNRILPTGFQKALSPKPPTQHVRPSPQPPQHPSSTQQQNFNNKKSAPGGRRESNLRYVESAEKEDVLGGEITADGEEEVAAEVVEEEEEEEEEEGCRAERESRDQLTFKQDIPLSIRAFVEREFENTLASDTITFRRLCTFESCTDSPWEKRRHGRTDN
ncbi:uncharacterized protein LAJ45_01645 [Morchella importuna]|uniref:uncharacterized protein n=1 Tax=Morchella importuna TaxID=1174673 RepID=UPI001E8D3C26|nr:uncharacterized protein LAJ45_01645 [Morchella importuna]KAH8153878.1 hypothetical protein LAJ45_01645 [Morchella importuna]